MSQKRRNLVQVPRTPSKWPKCGRCRGQISPLQKGLCVVCVAEREGKIVKVATPDGMVSPAQYLSQKGFA